MQRSASISRFSLESADCPNVPSSPKPLGKLGKLLGLKTDPSASNIKNHTTFSQSNNTRSLAFNSLKKSASSRPRPRNATHDNPRPLSDAPRRRNLNHSVSAPAMHASSLRPSRASSMRVQRPSMYNNANIHTHTILIQHYCLVVLGVFDGLSRTNNEPHLHPIRRQPELCADVPQITPEKKLKWMWKRRAFIPKRSHPPSPTLKENDVQETFANPYSTDVSTPQCHTPVVTESQVLDIVPLAGPSLPTLDDDDDICLTPISTRSSEHEQPMGHKVQRSRGSINKVARTLGFPEITFATEFGEVPLSAGYNSYNPFDSVDLYPVRKQGPAKLTRRLSLTLTTLTTIPNLFRPSPAVQRTSPASRSQISLSTLDVDDIHQFGLADDLSDTWGKISESRTSSSDLPVSPITFHIPPEIPPSSSPGKVKPSVQEEVSPPLPTLTCGRSQSLSSLQVRHVARTASRPDTPFDERTNTLVQVARSGSNSTSMTTEPHLTDLKSLRASTKTWNGEWNQDDMQHVIKKLRCLK
ncbi:hypothetical protein BDZ94DRAFT_234582 [Collybia nuda]|uniref:Uncharacterized protein n=1 Tax=Collybia nuda TaxID=64659 RepID=A0A9P5XVI5_9AGAR|nr:hypothetical protein BDZ94DRAFT_234582 [Collybia nuda]